MAQSNGDDELRQLAEQYAKDFGISYDKIRINPKGSVTYRQSGSNSGGWQESGESLNLPTWVITGHYYYRKQHELEARISTIKELNEDMYEQMPTGDISAWDMLTAITKLQSRWEKLLAELKAEREAL